MRATRNKRRSSDGPTVGVALATCATQLCATGFAGFASAWGRVERQWQTKAGGAKLGATGQLAASANVWRPTLPLRPIEEQSSLRGATGEMDQGVVCHGL